MSLPYIDESRQDYIDRQKGNQLHFAKLSHEQGNERGMWVHLITWAQCDDHYGEHWDMVNDFLEAIRNDQPI
jgi:hypothetical protein